MNNGLSLGDKTKKKIMIKASELRIGNLLSFCNGIEPTRIVTVGRRFFSSAAIEKEDGDFNVTPYYSGIALTEEWLLRFGFKEEVGQNEIYNISVIPSGLIKLNIFKWSEGWGVAFSDHYLPKIKTIENFKDIENVHQLQNLYFALTGRELQLAPSN